ncbi:MAG TPA: hypothetical protein PLU24_00510 [Candidatus Omnitrophota bacterium]|nr:hypothetical protein [Candidatus Omnitrophota bacterium]
MKNFILFFSVLILLGCVSVTAQKYYKDQSFPATDPSKVVVFASRPERAFTEIGQVSVEGASSWHQVEKMFRKKAGEMGADAVYVFTKVEEPRTYVEPYGCLDYGYYRPYYYRGWRHYSYFPSSYYCYGYQPTIDTIVYYSATGIAIKFKKI